MEQQTENNKPLYVASYIKQLALDFTGAKRVDSSVYAAAQKAIYEAMSNVTLEGDKAVNRGPQPDSGEEPDKPEPERKAGKADDVGEIVVLVKVANGRVYATHSNVHVHLLDFDRIGSMLGNGAYDAEVKDEIRTLRAIAPKIKSIDCNYIAKDFEERHGRKP